MLDYGCGRGGLVELFADAGFDSLGVDAFYGGGDASKWLEERGLLGTRIFGLEDEKIPFPGERFDVITSNQVFEHIDDFSTPIHEVHRVLKPGGLFINLFPTREVWREGHIGVPFIHWFAKDSWLRVLYARASRTLGIAYHKNNRSGREWVDYYLDWLDQWTHYKSRKAVDDTFRPFFTMESYGADYLLFRLSRHRLLRHLAPLLRRDIFRPLLEFLCRRLSGHVFVMRKR